MPTFSNHVPPDPRGPSFPIVRTPAFKPLVAIVTCEDLVGTFTHFHHGRTTPCEGDSCEACHDGLPYRWHAYVSAYNPDSGLHFLFESTAQAAQHFVEYRDAVGNLRGCKFEAKRLGGKPNGRVLMRTRTADMSGLRLPLPPDLTKVLAILWNLPSPDVTADRTEPEKKTPHIDTTPQKSRRKHEPGK